MIIRGKRLLVSSTTSKTVNNGHLGRLARSVYIATSSSSHRAATRRSEQAQSESFALSSESLRTGGRGGEGRQREGRGRRSGSAYRNYQQHQIEQNDNDYSDLNSRIKQIQAYTATLRKYIAEKDESVSKKKIAEEDKIQTNVRASEDEVNTLDHFLELGEEDEKEINQNHQPSPAQLPNSTGPLSKDGLGLFASPALSVSLSPAIIARIGRSAASISSKSPKDQNWLDIINTLFHGEGLKGLGITDVESLIQNIPLKQRASNGLMPIVHEMMTDAEIVPSKKTLDLIMAAYAENGQTIVVEAFKKQMLSQGFTPDVYTYGHLIKSMGKNHDLRGSSQKLQEMQALGIKPSLQIYTTILQTCIRVNDYNEAFRMFDMLKYMSLETQPDIRIYNSLLLAAAKQHNIEKVLDLLKEMTTRPIDPLRPNAETFNTLIFACARDRRTHLQAWKYLIEIQERGFLIDRKAINALMYLCGETGEVLFARAMFRKLCLNPVSYPDSFTFNCLLNAYSNYRPGVFSPVMASEFGAKVRSSFFLDDNMVSNDNIMMPPFLPITMLHSVQQVLAESNALLNFFYDYIPKMINDSVLLTYLKIPYKLGEHDEFISRYNSETYFLEAEWERVLKEEPETIETEFASAEETVDVDVTEVNSNKSQNFGKQPVLVVENSEKNLTLSKKRSSRAIPRNWKTYDLAIQACAISGDLDFAQGIWIERGKWRGTNLFRELPAKVRTSSDFSFARSMVELHSKCGELDQALRIVKSTIRQFHWKKYHITELINKLNEIEDIQSIKELTYLLATYHRTEQASSEYYDLVDRNKKS